MKFSFLLNKTYFDWDEPFISESQLREIGNINRNMQLFLKVQGADELITESNPVDLAREGIEQIYSKANEVYQYIVNERLFISHEPMISENEIRTVAKIPADVSIYFKVEGPDREVSKGQVIDLAPYQIEEFYTRAKQLVSINIDNKDYKVKPGVYTVQQLKVIGGVKPSYELDQLIDGQLKPLDDAAEVTIKGCEIFKSQPKDGSSS